MPLISLSNKEVVRSEPTIFELQTAKNIGIASSNESEASNIKTTIAYVNLVYPDIILAAPITIGIVLI